MSVNAKAKTLFFFNQEKKKRYMEHLTNIKWHMEKESRDRPQLNKQIKYVGCQKMMGAVEENQNRKGRWAVLGGRGVGEGFYYFPQRGEKPLQKKKR